MISIFLATLLTMAPAQNVHSIQHPDIQTITVSSRVQSNEQWGMYALTQAQRRYPSYEITDYLHVGRTTYTSTYVKETFKFWLKRGRTEFGVFVNVYFDPNTDHVSRVLFCETEK